MSLVVAIGLLLTAAQPANAAKAVDRFFPEVGAGGGLGGQFSTPRGIAVRASTGQIYVVDTANHRVQRFASDGSFQRAWGVDVVDGVENPLASGDTGTGAAAGFEICVAAAHCKAGIAGAGNPADALRNGQLNNPQGIAVNETTGDVYVRDRNNLRVNQYTADGGFVRSWGWNVIAAGSPGNVGTEFEVCPATEICQAGTGGAGDGQFGAGTTSAYDGTGIAVDPTSQDVFVVDPGGSTNRRFQRFTATGAFVAKFGAAGTGTGLFGSTSSLQVQPNHVAVGADGIVYVSDCQGNVHVVERYDLGAGAFLDPIPVAAGSCSGTGNTHKGLAIDPDGGNLLVARPGTQGIVELDVSVEPAVVVDTHLAGAGLVANGLAVDSGDLFFTSTGDSAHRVYVADDDGAPGSLDATLDPPTGVTAHEAQFTGTVDPGGFPVDYRFEYSKTGVEDDWAAVADYRALGSGTDPVEVPVDEAEGSATGLEACTLYRVRISAIRGYGNGSAVSAELSFVTDCTAPAATTQPVLSVDENSAQLRGTVNPNGTATTYRFEYGTTTSYGQSAPVPDASAGASGLDQQVSQPIEGLQPETVYHYRLVATNALGTSVGADRTFATLPVPASGQGRGFELVSPPDKVGGMGVGPWYNGIGSTAWAGTAAQEGERFAVRGAYGSTIVDAGMAWAHDFGLAERSPKGWGTRPFLKHPATGSPAYRMVTIRSAAPDLDKMVVQSNGDALRMFDEMADWTVNTHGDPSLIGDWQARWEIFGPTGDGQMPTVANAPANAVSDTAVSADGSHVVGFGPMRGVLGSEDPTQMTYPDLIAGRTIYIDDLSAGLSDSFPGAGVRALVNACTPGTMVPRRQGSGLMGDQSCPDPPGPPTATLVSRRGAALQSGGQNDQGQPGGPLHETVSADGSRVFFMAPDPQGGGAQTECEAAPATEADTQCPPQLYVRQRMDDGSVAVRWLSRAVDGLFGSQAASLTGPVRFEGATPDGSKVFFRTNSPLTDDDPNGLCGTPCTTGSVSNDSWDLYLYELPGDLSTDPAEGTLTRISRGPTGLADANGHQETDPEQGLLRFVTEDGQTAYFVTSAALPGVTGSDNGTVTSPGGTASNTATVNLYRWHRDGGGSEQWRFIARLPRGTGASLATCASTGSFRRSALSEVGSLSGIVGIESGNSSANCMRGSSDGEFLTWWTDGQLTADDPDATTGDIYGYDAATDELVRLSRPQGGAGNPYQCSSTRPGSSSPVAMCFGDGGFQSSSRDALPFLGVAVEPDDAGDRIAFFQSRSRLVPEDGDDAYDVYSWRNGDLTLVSSGASSTDGAFYKGNDRSGRNVYFVSRDHYSWQDVDSVLDVYTARVGGGIPEPPPPVVCGLLAGGCHGGGFDSVSTDTKTQSSSESDNAKAEARKTLAVSRLSKKARRKASRTGRLPLKVRASRAGVVRLTARAKVGKKARRVGRASKRVRAGQMTRVNLRLTRAARKRLRAGKKLRLTVEVRQSGARTRTRSILLPGVKS